MTGPPAARPAFPPPRLRRARHRLRSRVFTSPLYLPYARLRFSRDPSPAVVGARTELVIDGYFRSANTFAVYAFQLGQDRPVRLAHHLHAPAQLLAAARRGLPALLLIREPRDAILSELLYDRGVTIRGALAAYHQFYVCLLPSIDRFVVGEFGQVTTDLGGVTRQLNERFGTRFAEVTPTAAGRRECFELMRQRGTLSPVLLGFESGLVSRDELRAQLPAIARQPRPAHLREAWVPSGHRARLTAALAQDWLAPDLAQPREQAEHVYQEVLAAAACHTGAHARAGG